jgi:hypothetical protein
VYFVRKAEKRSRRVFVFVVYGINIIFVYGHKLIIGGEDNCLP